LLSTGWFQELKLMHVSSLMIVVLNH